MIEEDFILGLKTSVESFMRSPPVMVLFSDTALSVAEKMIVNNIGAVIVMRRGTPVGIVTEKDLVRKIVIGRKDSAKTKAEDVMSAPLVWIESDESVADALEMMRENSVRRLAVTRNGRLVGIVTERRLRKAHQEVKD